MNRRPQRKVFTNKMERVSISSNLDKLIKQFQRRLLKEEIKKYGKQARPVSYIWASDEMSKFVKGVLK